jgi:hypothetical protein
MGSVELRWGTVAALSLAELESLDPALDLFRASPPVPVELVAEGLHPPLPVCGPALAWGFPLLAAARAAGLAALECRLLGERSAAARLALALRLEARPGGYHWSEKLAMHRYARSHGFGLGELGGLIEGRPDPRLEQKLEVFAALPPALAAMVEEGDLDLRAASGLRELPAEVFPLAFAAALSFSERKAFLGLLRDAGLGPQATVEAARGALAGPRPLEALGELASPALATLRREWRALEESILGGSGVRLDPPEHFEGERFEVRFRFRNREDLTRRLAALTRLEARFDDLASFLR